MSDSKKKYNYQAFGLTLSSEIVFPELAESDKEPEITIEYGIIPDNINTPFKESILYQANKNEFLIKGPVEKEYKLVFRVIGCDPFQCLQGEPADPF